MVDDVAAGRADAFRAEVVRVAVADHYEKFRAVGGGDYLGREAFRPLDRGAWVYEPGGGGPFTVASDKTAAFQSSL